MPRKQEPVSPYFTSTAENLKAQAFTLETIAHLRGYELELLAHASELRNIASVLEDLAKKAKVMGE